MKDHFERNCNPYVSKFGKRNISILDGISLQQNLTLWSQEQNVGKILMFGPIPFPEFT